MLATSSMSTMRRRSQMGPRTDTTYDIYVYMTEGKYPDGANENARRNLRKRSKMFKLKGSELFHVSTTKDRFGKDVQRERIVLTDNAKRTAVISELHVDEKGNHLGREKVLSALTEKYYFVGMNNKVREYLLNCSSCRSRFKLEGLSDGSTSAVSDLDDMDDNDSNASFSEDGKQIKSEWPARSQEALHFWDIVELNVMGPYDCIDSKHYIIVFLDLFSNWPEAFVVDSVSPSVVTHLLLNLICRFGCMKTLMIRESTNCAKEDLAPLQKSLEKSGIDININQFSSALSEKIWKEMGDNLDSFTKNNSHWPHCLEFALLPHRVSRPERSEYTPAYITYGRELNLPSSMHKGEGDNFPSAEPHLSLEDMKALSDKFQIVYSSYGKNIQAWNSCSQPFCVIPSLNSSETVKTPGKRGRKKKNPAPPPPPEEQDSDKEAQEDMPPPATDVTPRTTGRKRKRNISRITRLINAEDDEDDEDPPPKQDPDDKDYSPSGKMVKVNTEQELDAYYRAIFQYKKHRSYLPGCPDNYKRVLRKSAISYALSEDKLFYIIDGELRYVPMTWKERLFYLASAHTSQKGKHINKNTMAQWMTDKKIVWKGISVDCTAFAAACPHCTLGERKSEPISKQSFKDDPVLKMAEDNYSLLLNYLQKQTFPSTTPQSQKDTVTSIARNFVIQKGVLYYKKGKMGDLRCLEVGTKDRKVAMQAAHVSNDEHFGPGDTFSRLSDKFVWNRMAESVNNFIAGCCKKKEEESAAPKALLNRNVDFFNKQFLNGTVDKILDQGKEKYSMPVIKDKSEHIKEEPKSPEREEEAMEIGEKNEENKKQEGNVSVKKNEVKGEGNETQKGQDMISQAGETEEKTKETEKQEENETQNQNSCKEQSPQNEKTSPTKSFTRGSKKGAPGLETMITTTVGNVMKTGLVSDRVTRTAVNSIIPPEELEEEGEKEMQSENSTMMATKMEDIPTSSSMSFGFKENGDEKSASEEKKGKAIHLVCEYCGMIFKGHNKYKIHMYGHTGVKPYPCNLCDKSFTLKKTLKFHLGKHAGQKPFLCNICGKRFHVPNSLRSHLQIHAKGGNNIHYCKLCNREFATDARFEKHLKFKHPPEEEEHLCSQCGKKFCSRKSLKRHEKSAHDAVKSHFCAVCERGFFRKEYLNRHMQQHELQTEGGTKKMKPLVIRKPKALQSKKPAEKTVSKSQPGNIIIQTVQDGENASISNVVGNIRIEVEPGQVEEYFIQEGDGSTENMYYAVETNEVDQEGGGSTLVYSFPSVQYEIECPDGQLNQEALSAITMLAQASSQQNV